MNNDFVKVLQHYNLIDGPIAEKFKIICPIHGDINPSMLIDLRKGEYYCFGCNQRGNALKFVKQIENVNDLQAMIKYNKIINDQEDQIKIKIRTIPKLTDERAIFEARRYFCSLSKTDWRKDSEARLYMLKRGFDIKTLEKCHARENQNSDYGIIFPILQNGQFKGYVCRATNKEMEKKRKYLYNTGFSRYNSFFGDARFKTVILCEGTMDYLKLLQFGLSNVVAILGWRITDAQINEIKKYTDNVISALDNTDTGKQGTEYLKNYFNVVRYQFPENVKDPGDFDEFDFYKSWADTKKEAEKHNFIL